MGFADKYSTAGRFMKKEDLPPSKGVNLTIKGWSNFEDEDTGKQKLVLMWTTEKFKPMICNTTNAKLLEVMFSANTEDDLIGKTINVYHDPLVTFAGNVVGGLKVGPAKERPAAQQEVDPTTTPPQPVATPPNPDDDIPF